MDHPVAKAVAKASAWTADQESALTDLVTANTGSLTYAEISASFESGAFTAKQVQGKILSMELFSHVRKAEKKAAPRLYSTDEEVRFIGMVKDGASMEILAEGFNRSIASVRGKALSLLRSEDIAAMPKQETSNAKARVDVLEGLNVSEFTVEELVAKTERTERGIKSMLSRRGLSCSDYDGAAKRAKLDKAAD
jgi:hypothetical protein